MFSIIGYQDYTKVYTMFGDFLKAKGVTPLGSAGSGIEPSSKEKAEENAASAKHAGIKVGYLNTAFPLGSTNVAPLVLAMKAAGIDGLATRIVTNSSFAIVNGLKHQGMNLKVNLAPTGYGGDLIQGGPGTDHSAQNSYFLIRESRQVVRPGLPHPVVAGPGPVVLPAGSGRPGHRGRGLKPVPATVPVTSLRWRLPG
jgi:branched-chain amino acid transport system substrate-binding protein